ncbi:putative disease resistance RPP13-like protein 1 [Abrus precatorius]|uniref:Disease resistance RPP13-like protein 1 n=1 Tax=Abrus precatorius TaxID=3816 RepID=A0A8B8KAJ6_ABRPR|nr:putative disease resistance RPP13-like protein 1 [Abrus precatorius]
MESVGAEYFNELLFRSLIEKDKTTAEEKFRMHDLIYDLARPVSEKSSCYFEGDEIAGSVRHLSFLRQRFDIYKKFEGLHERNCLRTFLPHVQFLNTDYYLSKTVSHDWLPKQRCLRTLSLSNYKNIVELPKSVGNLVLLRYLDLSYTSIKNLPDEIFELYNLQTLKLSNCKSLMELSRQIGNLVNLRHLDISDTNLVEMPAEICRLQDLRTLTSFIVGEEDGLRISELRKFPYLQGKLSILKLHNVVDPMDAFQANLKNKEQIEELMLEWGSDPQDSQAEKDVLDNLQPSTMLKKLSIRYYNGTSFPKWLGDSSYCNVRVLWISDCNYCLSLPPFGQLPSLKELVVERMKMVKTVGQEFYCSNASCPSFQPFPLLESLEFEEMSEWEEWVPFEGSNFPFPCLKSLCLSKCPLLRGNLPNGLPSLKEVRIKECNQFDGFVSIEKCDSLQCLPRMILNANSLRRLNLRNIKSLISLPADGLPTSVEALRIDLSTLGDEEVVNTLLRESSLPTSLTYLRLWNFDGLKRLEGKGLQHLTSLKTLYIFECGSLESLPEDQLPSSLELLCIISCPLLEERYGNEKGKHFTKIAHIPAIQINDQVII